MRKWLVVIFAAVMLATSAIADDVIRWKPVCRHRAIYWASMVAEQYPVRIKYGYFEDRLKVRYYHVQPQLFMGEQWWYFKVVSDKHVRIMTRPEFTLILPSGEEEKPKWVPVLHWPSLYSYMKYLEKLQVKGPK